MEENTEQAKTTALTFHCADKKAVGFLKEDKKLNTTNLLCKTNVSCVFHSFLW